MALGKYARIDGHNSSNYCLTISIVVFISTCLIGAWMTMSSSINPLRVGVTLQQFMGGMPKKASEIKADSSVDTLKVNASQEIMQDDKKPYMQGIENLNPNVPQSPKGGEKHETHWMDEKEGKVENNLSSPDVAEGSVLGSGEKNGSLGNYSGRDSADTSDEKVNVEKLRDEKEGNTESIVNVPFVAEGSVSGDGEKKVSQGNDSGQDSADTSIEKSRDEKEANSKNIVNAPYLTEGSISGDGEKKGSQEINSGQDSADTSDQENTTEKPLNSTLQENDYVKESADGRKQVGETETKEFQEKTSSEKEEVNAMKMEDGEINQFEKSGQEQSKGLEGDSSGSPSGLVSDDRKETFDEIAPKAMPWPTQAAESPKERPSPIKEMPNELSPPAMPWPTQAAESKKEKMSEGFSSSRHQSEHSWKVCNVTAGTDYIPCLDNIKAIKKLRTTAHYEHRERHCPEEAPTCLVPLPGGYRKSIKWPKSRDMIWFSNVPHTKLAQYKGGQNWVKVLGQYSTFPGGGTQFKYGALHYIDYLEKSVPDIAWGKRSRVVLDVGCGVASFGGYLFDRDVLTMSLAPKDEHEAQVQFALERGIPAISAVMGTKRLPFPSRVFDIVHCARCRVPWHIEGGKLLLELNRVLRPGGYFVWSATPVYRKDAVNAAIWKDMSVLTKAICWELVKVERDQVNRKAAATFRKPTSNYCYEQRSKNDPPFCEESDDPNAAWYTPLVACIHKLPTDTSERGSQWPMSWPLRLEKPPYWLKGSEASSEDFTDDYNHWKEVMSSTYLNKSGIDWSSVRNVMDMRASYGGFAAALRDLQVWVMNVVPVNSSDKLPIIYERGLFGIYHNWCESFSTYPRSYDLLHADKLFSVLEKRCNFVAVIAEVDRILRPGGWLLVIDDAQTISEVEHLGKSLHWKILFSRSKDNNQVLCLEKTMWRPSEVETIPSAIGHAGRRT